MGQNLLAPNTDATASQVSTLQTSVNALPTSASLSSQAGVAIKSIQRGTVGNGSSALTASATISAVNVNKCELRYLGVASGNAAMVTLASSTIISFNFSTYNMVVSWELTERY